MFVQDLSTGESGLLQVTLEGIGLKFATRRVSCTFVLPTLGIRPSDCLVFINEHILTTKNSRVDENEQISWPFG